MFSLNHASARRTLTLFVAAASVAAACATAPTAVRAQETAASIAASAASAANTTTKRVLVQPMKTNRTIEREAPSLGSIMSEMLTTALLARNVRVVERQQLDALEAEKNLGSGVLDTNSAQKTGKIKGASIAVIGTITEFGVRDVKKGGIGLIGVLAGGGVKQSELRIKLDAHLVDIATGDIMPGSQVEQEGKQVDTSWVGGVGGIFKGIPVGVVGGSSMNEWLESKAGKAARKVVEEIADKIAAKIPRSAAGADEEETREIEVVGLDDFSDADSFIKALKTVPGIVSVESGDFADGTQKMTVTASVKTLKNLPSLLQTDSNLKPFGFKVSAINKERIQLKKKK